jgi:hypothetical protein
MDPTAYLLRYVCEVLFKSPVSVVQLMALTCKEPVDKDKVITVCPCGLLRDYVHNLMFELRCTSSRCVFNSLSVITTFIVPTLHVQKCFVITAGSYTYGSPALPIFFFLTFSPSLFTSLSFFLSSLSLFLLPSLFLFINLFLYSFFVYFFIFFSFLSFLSLLFFPLCSFTLSFFLSPSYLSFFHSYIHFFLSFCHSFIVYQLPSFLFGRNGISKQTYCRAYSN